MAILYSLTGSQTIYVIAALFVLFIKQGIIQWYIYKTRDHSMVYISKHYMGVQVVHYRFNGLLRNIN